MDDLLSQGYRGLLRERIATHKKSGGLKLKSLAAKIGVQYTFLSRALKDSKVQLNEDALFNLCKILRFSPQEVDLIFLLRQKENSNLTDRQKFLDKKILQNHKLSQLTDNDYVVQSKSLASAETRFLLNPLAMVVHIALGIPKYQKDTKWLAHDLKISQDELESILQDLDILGLISLKENSKHKIESVNKDRLHVSAEHPLMRTHQQLLKTEALQRLPRVADSQKISYLATFTISKDSLPKLRAAKDEFVAKIKKVSMDSSPETLYQLSLDVFPWV